MPPYMTSLSFSLVNARSLFSSVSALVFTATTFPFGGKFAVYNEKSRKLNDNVAHLSARLKSSDIYVQRANLQRVKYVYSFS